jgi:hypothetical protein
MKTSELIGKPLAFAVAKCEDVSVALYGDMLRLNMYEGTPVFGPEYRPDLDWSIAGPLIERERINVCEFTECGRTESGSDILIHRGWRCYKTPSAYWRSVPNSYGPTPLVAAMRCYVASKLGDEVEIPEELK